MGAGLKTAAALCLLAVLLALANLSYGQTIASQKSEARADDNGAYYLSLYYGGADHKTKITAQCSKITSIRAESGGPHKAHTYMRNNSTSWTVTSSNTGIATVTSPASTTPKTTSPTKKDFWLLYPSTTLKIPAGYKTKSVTVDKLCSGPAGANGFAAGKTGNYTLNIGAGTAVWGISTDEVGGAHNYYSKDMLLRVNLDPITYQVKYDGGGAEGSMPNSTHTYNAARNLTPNAYVRQGYEFAGWNTEADGSGTAYEDGQSVKNLSSVQGSTVTLYAQYRKIYDFSIGKTVSGIEFDRFSPDENGAAEYRFQLGDGQQAVFPGLEQGAAYTVREEGTKNYAPAYEVSEGASGVAKPSGEAGSGEALSSQEETLSQNTAFDFVNTQRQPAGTGIVLRKELAGDSALITDADRGKLFAFRYCLEGLDPDVIYTVELEGATDVEGRPQENASITPSAGGTAEGIIRLHAGERAEIKDLPDKTKYTLEEIAAGSDTSGGRSEYTVWYRVTDGEESTNTDYRFFPAGEAGNAGTSEPETLEKGVPVEFTFTNAKYEHHDLTFIKQRTEDGADAPGSGSDVYRIIAHLSGLEPETTYRTSGAGSIQEGEAGMTPDTAGGIQEDGAGGIRSDAAGCCEVRMELKASDRFTIKGLPGSVKVTLSEEAGPYVPSLSVSGGGETICRESGEYGRPFEAEFEGLSADAEAVLTNEYPRHSDLQITKEYDGLYDGEAAVAEFTVHLQGLKEGKKYSVRKLNAEGELLAEETVGPSADGTAESGADGTVAYGFTLKDGQLLQILRLPAEAAFYIEEKGQEGVLPSYVVTSAETQDLKSNSGSAGKGETLQTATERMTVDRQYSFYNAIPSEPVKTVSDGDGITKTGAGEEIEAAENLVPKMTSGWVYHISQKVPVPVTEFRLVDTLPAYVRTTVFDSSAGERDAPFRVYWRSPDGSSSRGGAVTEYDRETGEYLVKDAGGAILFSVTYDKYADGPRSSLTIRAEDERMLLEGGTFDLYFKAFIDKEATKEKLVSADEYDGTYFTFDNEATTFIGSYVCETNRVRTWIPESRGLTVRKEVNSAQRLKEPGRRFSFHMTFDGLTPGEEYSFRIPSIIETSLILTDGQLRLQASDETGKEYKDVTARIVDGDGRAAANLTIKNRATLKEGAYTVTFERGDLARTEEFEIERTADGGLVLAQIPRAAFFDGGREQVFRADAGSDAAGAGSDAAAANSNAAAASSKASVSFELADGQRAVFEDLPAGAEYEIEESAADGYAPAYTAVTGAASVGAAGKSSGSTVGKTGRALRTGRNTVLQNTDAAFVFTNTRALPKVRVLKTDAEGRPVRGAKLHLYEGRLEIPWPKEPSSHLEYLPEGTPVYTWETDENGMHPDSSGENVEDGYLPLAPGEYTVFESDVPEGSGLGLAEPVHILVREGEPAQSVTLVDEPAAVTDLILRKNVTGDLGDRSKQFEFTAELSGLEPGATYDTPADPQIGKAEVFTADEHGEAVITVRLKDDEETCFPALPYGATYRITEAASDHVSSYRIASDEGEGSILKPEDTNGRISHRSLATAEETVDSGEGVVRVVFTNNRQLGVLTGIPGPFLTWIVCLAMIGIAAFGAALTKRRKVLEYEP